MIGFAHELALLACQKTWSTLALSIVEFRKLFPTWIEQSRADELFAALTAPGRFSGQVKATTIAVASNGATLPQTTVSVVSTANFPDVGLFALENARGFQIVYYTGKTATQFTGCTGGSGTISTGMTVRASTPDYVKFGLADLQGPSNETPPGVFTRSSSGRPDSTPAALEGTTLDEGWMLVANTVEIVCLARQQQLAGALAAAMASCLYTELDNLLEDAADDFAILDIGDIAPMRDLLPERGTCSWVRLRVRLNTPMGLHKINKPPVVARGFSVHDERTRNAAGRPGKVRPRR